MFCSKKRAVNIPQFEHARLAATLAAAWGNDAFLAPPIDRASLVRGVLLHDRGYGLDDNLPLLALPEQEWQNVMERGLEMGDPDPLADQIARLHINRLLFRGAEDPQVAKAAQDRYQALCQLPGHPWHWIDSVTNLYDRLSFEFCFEVASSKNVELQMAEQVVDFHYGMQENGELFCSPWPFSGEAVSGIILGFERDGYPQRRVPVVLEFTARQ